METRVVNTGLTGQVNKDLLDSVINFASFLWDGRRYWKNVEIDEQEGSVVIVVKDGQDSGFRGKSDTWIKSWFAGKIKEIVYYEMEYEIQGSETEGQAWDAKDPTVLKFLSGLTVSDAYRAFENLKSASTTLRSAAESAVVSRLLGKRRN